MCQSYLGWKKHNETSDASDLGMKILVIFGLKHQPTHKLMKQCLEKYFHSHGQITNEYF